MKKNKPDKPRVIIGRVEHISFPELGIEKVPARVDTGARTSAVWASDIYIDGEGQLRFYLFDKSSPYFVDRQFTFTNFSEIVVANSMGATERRYKIKLLVKLKGRKIRASFALTANRSQQVYPILLGRNVLRGKFVVDVKEGKPLLSQERARIDGLQKLLDN